MGKDFTPREMHLVDKQNPQMKHAVLTDQHGKKAPLYDFSKPIAVSYPNMFFLFGEENMKGLKPATLEMAERHLTHAINADDGNRPMPENSDEMAGKIQAWYRGKLASYFYYNTENNRLLREALGEWEKKHP